MTSQIHEECGVMGIFGADTLAFISEEGLKKAGKNTGMCLACFNCEYPTDIYSHSMVAGGLDEMS